MYVCMYVRMYVCMYVCMYVGGRQAARQAEERSRGGVACACMILCICVCISYNPQAQTVAGSERLGSCRLSDSLGQATRHWRRSSISSAIGRNSFASSHWGPGIGSGLETWGQDFTVFRV